MPNPVTCAHTCLTRSWSRGTCTAGHVHSHVLNPTSYTLNPTSYTLNPTSYTLNPTSYTLHPTPYTLNPTSYTLNPTSYTLNPTSYTLHPKSGYTHSWQRSMASSCAAAAWRRFETRARRPEQGRGWLLGGGLGAEEDGRGEEERTGNGVV